MFGSGGIRWVAIAALCFAWDVVKGDEVTHIYSDGEAVVVWADKMFPILNPQEIYAYSSAPVCEFKDLPESMLNNKKNLNIGEVFEGHTLEKSPKLKIEFNKAKKDALLCEMIPSEEQATQLAHLVKNSFHYVYYVDELPVDMCRFGEMLEGAPHILTHRDILIQYNGSQIIVVEMVPSKPAAVQAGFPLTFTYSVAWAPTDVPFSDRFNRYLDESGFEQKAHWFSVVNSIVLCVFLCAVVVIILARTLKNDFARYAASEAAELESLDRGDDGGWKQIHGDVFRRPAHLQAFSVVISTGVHITLTLLVVILLAVVNSYYAERGMTSTATFLTYIVLQPVNGAVGGFVFRMYGGRSWRAAMLSQLLGLPTFAAMIFGSTSAVASVYSSSMALPPKIVFTVLGLFFFICTPLHIIGAKIGRGRAVGITFPCRVHQLKRPIPPRSRAFLPLLMSITGLVPFGCVFVELYFMFQAMWNYRFYYFFGFVAIVFILVCCVLVCVSITSVYLLLDSEDYRWAWISFLSCATTAVYSMVYAVYYFHSTQMHGILQSVLYFGSTVFFCACLALFCGSIGYIGASRFVWLIYRNIKVD